MIHLALSILLQILPFPGATPGAGSPVPAFTTNEITCSQYFSNSLSCTLPSTPTSGNCLVLGFGSRVNVGPVATINSVTQTNVTWVSAGTGSDGGSNSVSVWVGAVAASASASLTISYGGGNNAAGAANIREAINIPNCDATSVDAAFVSATNVTGTASTGTYTTTHPIDLVYVLSKLIGSNCPAYTGQPAGYTAITCIAGPGGTDAVQPDYTIVGSAGSQSASWTLNSSQAWLTGIVALKGN